MRKIILFVIIGFLFLAFYGCAPYPAEPLLVKTANINNNPLNYDGQFIAIKGRVTANGSQPSLGIGWYDVADETDTLAVLTTATGIPPVGAEVWVSGTVTAATKVVGTRTVSCVIQEKELKRIGGITGNLPLIIGGVVVVLLILIVVFVLTSKKSAQPAYVQRQPYPGQPQYPQQPGYPPSGAQRPGQPQYPQPGYQPPQPQQPPSQARPTVIGMPSEEKAGGKETVIMGKETTPVLAYLIVKSGTRTGKDYRLKEVNNIGRDPSNDITLDDSAVSRQHAKIRIEEGKFVIYDLASANGTLVFGQKVQSYTLEDGDEITIGKTTFVFKKA